MICVQSSSHMPSSHFKWQFYPPPNSRCWIKVTKILESTLASCLSCDLFSFFLRVEQQRDKDNAQLLNLHFHAHQIADVNTRIKDLGACNPWFRVLSRLTVFREPPIFVFANNVYNIKMSIQSLILILKIWPKETFCPFIHPVFSLQKPHVRIEFFCRHFRQSTTWPWITCASIRRTRWHFYFLIPFPQPL